MKPESSTISNRMQNHKLLEWVRTDPNTASLLRLRLTLIVSSDFTISAPGRRMRAALAIHRADPAYFEMRDCDKSIDICLWYPEDGKVQAVDSTRAWNFQQGSRLQWLPGRTDTIAFNAIENGRAVSVMRNIASGERRVLPASIYVFSPDGRILDFAELHNACAPLESLRLCCAGRESAHSRSGSRRPLAA